MDTVTDGTDGNGGDIEFQGGEGSANGNGAGGDVILRHHRMQ